MNLNAIPFAARCASRNRSWRKRIRLRRGRIPDVHASCDQGMAGRRNKAEKSPGRSDSRRTLGGGTGLSGQIRREDRIGQIAADWHGVGRPDGPRDCRQAVRRTVTSAGGLVIMSLRGRMVAIVRMPGFAGHIRLGDYRHGQRLRRHDGGFRPYRSDGREQHAQHDRESSQQPSRRASMGSVKHHRAVGIMNLKRCPYLEPCPSGQSHFRTG